MQRQRYEDFWSSSEAYHRNVGQIVVDYTGIENCVFDTVMHMMQPRGIPPAGQDSNIREYLNDGWQEFVHFLNGLPVERRYGSYINTRIAMARRVRNFLAHASLLHIDESDVTGNILSLRSSGLSRAAAENKFSDIISVPISEVSEAAGFVAALRDLCDDIYDHLYDCGYTIDDAFNLEFLNEPKFFIENFLSNNQWLNSRVVLPILDRVEKHDPQSLKFMPRDFLIEFIEREGR